MSTLCSTPGILPAGLAALLVATSVRAHAHHDAAEIDTGVPFDALIWIHMTVQAVLWAVSFPLGMVLGFSKSKYHVPLQSLNVILTYAAAYLGHHHKGRQFPATVHGIMAKVLIYTMVTQAIIGIFLKLHVFEQSLFRRGVKVVHRVLGVLFPLLGWIQMLFGITTALDLCGGQTLGQCVSSYTAGSAMVGYAVVLVVLVHVGAGWLEDKGVGQEMLEGGVVAVAGLLTIFLGGYRPGSSLTAAHSSEDPLEERGQGHKSRFLRALSVLLARHGHHAVLPPETEDVSPAGWMHVVVGLIWFIGGVLGVFMCTRGLRSFMPGIIVCMTGIGIAVRGYSSPISSAVHILLGSVFALVGAVRVVEIAIRPVDSGSSRQEGHIGTLSLFSRHAVVFLSVLGGTVFMSSTDQSVHRAEDANVHPAAYTAIDLALAIFIYALISFLAYTYSHTGAVALGAKDSHGGVGMRGDAEGGHGQYSRVAGGAGATALPGAEAFELEDTLEGGTEVGTDWEEASSDEDAIKIGGEDEVDLVERPVKEEGRAPVQ